MSSSIGDQYPAFLRHLDDDPEGAFADFYAFLQKVFARYPPRVFRMVREDSREDVIHDIAVHCCEREFRVLRAYQDVGAPFGVWLHLVATRRILDQLGKKRGAEKSSERVEVDEWFEGVYAGDELPPDRDVARKVLLEKTVNAMGQLGERCRLLLLAAAEGWKPREMAELLGDPNLDNKKISDGLRECRRQLRWRIRKEGINPESVSVFWRPAGKASP
jgi:RNA polymerase sigma factor (sigma-70 family)